MLTLWGFRRAMTAISSAGLASVVRPNRLMIGRGNHSVNRGIAVSLGLMGRSCSIRRILAGIYVVLFQDRSLDGTLNREPIGGCFVEVHLPRSVSRSRFWNSLDIINLLLLLARILSVSLLSC